MGSPVAHMTLYTFKELVVELESERDTVAMGYQGIENEMFVDYAFEPMQCSHHIRQTCATECNNNTGCGSHMRIQSKAPKRPLEQGDKPEMLLLTLKKRRDNAPHMPHCPGGEGGGGTPMSM
jgi:hypothetical protein